MEAYRKILQIYCVNGEILLGRVEKSFRNSVAGIFLQGVTMVSNLVTRMVLVYFLGNIAVSVNGLFTEIIAMLSLAELGVGTAIVYSLYKPLHEKNESKIIQLMTLFKTAYRVIAGAIVILGVCLTPFLQYLVDTNLEWSLDRIRFIFILFVLRTACSYLFCYKSSLLNADQNAYVVSIVSVAFKVITCIADTAILFITKNFIAYLVSEIVCTLLNNIVISIVANKRYPYLKKSDFLPKDERKQVFKNIGFLFVGKASAVVTNSTDNILISTLVGTLAVGPYSQYSVLLQSVKSVFGKVASGMTGSIGNLMACESKEHCANQLRRLTYMFYVPSLICCICCYNVLTPAVVLLFGKKYIIDQLLIFVVVLNSFFWIAREPLWTYLQVSGLFKKDAVIAVVGTTVNLFVSIVFGIYYGMVGIFAGTMLTMVIQLVLKTILIYKKKFHQSFMPYLFEWLFYTATLVIGMLVSYYLCSLVSVQGVLIQIVINGIISFAVSVMVILLTVRHKYFKFTVSTVKHLFKRKKGVKKNG